MHKRSQVYFKNKKVTIIRHVGFYLTGGAHILGNPNMDKETSEAINAMISLAKKIRIINSIPKPTGAIATEAQ